MKCSPVSHGILQGRLKAFVLECLFSRCPLWHDMVEAGCGMQASVLWVRGAKRSKVEPFAFGGSPSGTYSSDRV